jgi:transmembrane protein EpsG
MTILIYLMALFFSVFFAVLATKNIVARNKLLKVSFINLLLSLSIITLLIGLRSEIVGTDTFYYIQEYYAFYDEFNYSNIFLNYLEPGHAFISYQLNNLEQSHTIYLLTFSTLSLFFFFLFYKDKKEYLPWAIFFAFCIGFIFLMMNGIRQGLAISILALSIKYVTNRNPLKFLGIVLFASLFHYSALLMLPIYFINHLSKVNYKLWAVLFLVSVFITPYNLFDSIKNILSFVPKNYSYYLDQIGLDDSKFSLGFLYHLLLSFLALYLSTKITYDKFNKNILNLYFVGIILMNVTFQYALLQRFNIYFIFFQIPAMAYITFSLNKKNQTKLVALVTLLYLIGFIYKIIIGDSNCCPYEFSFN